MLTTVNRHPVAVHVPFARFGAAPPAQKQPDPARLAQYQAVLATFIEKNRTLTLPDPIRFPDCVKDELAEAMNSISPERLAHLKSQNAFGMNEEASDMVYFLMFKVLLQSGFVTENYLKRFKANVDDLMRSGKPEVYRQMSEIADRYVHDKDVYALRKYLPGSWNQERTNLMRGYIKMILLDYAVGLHSKRKGWDLADMALIDKKFVSEFVELQEHMAAKKIPVEDQPTIPANGFRGRDDFRNLVASLIKVSGARLEDLMQFAIWKSSARTEFIFKNPDLDYDNDVKPMAKAWEKLLEARAFLAS